MERMAAIQAQQVKVNIIQAALQNLHAEIEDREAWAKNLEKKLEEFAKTVIAEAQQRRCSPEECQTITHESVAQKRTEWTQIQLDERKSRPMETIRAECERLEAALKTELAALTALRERPIR